MLYRTEGGKFEYPQIEALKYVLALSFGLFCLSLEVGLLSEIERV